MTTLPNDWRLAVVVRVFHRVGVVHHGQRRSRFCASMPSSTADGRRSSECGLVATAMDPD
jgi:hypothetical protein